jgi:hypothetical protein
MSANPLGKQHSHYWYTFDWENSAQLAYDQAKAHFYKQVRRSGAGSTAIHNLGSSRFDNHASRPQLVSGKILLRADDWPVMPPPISFLAWIVQDSCGDITKSKTRVMPDGSEGSWPPGTEPTIL